MSSHHQYPRCNNVITHPTSTSYHTLPWLPAAAIVPFEPSQPSITAAAPVFAPAYWEIQCSSSCIDSFLSIFGLRYFLQFVPRLLRAPLATPVPHFIRPISNPDPPFLLLFRVSRAHASLACAILVGLSSEPLVTAS